MNGAEFLANCLKNEGVDVAFGVPGDEAIPLVAAMGNAGIRLVPAHTSAAAVWMAAAHGCFARRPGVVFTCPGAGAVDMATALASCTRDGFPVVACIGGHRVDRQLTVAPEHLDLTWALRPFCKQTASLAWGPTIRNEIREAFRTAYREKPGAVACVLPEDVAQAPVDAALQPVSRYRQGRAYPEVKAVEDAARYLDSAARPVILAGHGVLRSGAHEELLAVAEKGHIPVVTTFMGKAAIPFDHPLCAGADAGADALVLQADVVLTVGYEPGEWPPFHWNRDFQATILHLSELPAAAQVHYSPVVEMIGDLNAGLGRLSGLLEPRHRQPWSGPEGAVARAKQHLLQEMEAVRHDPRFPIHPGRLVQELRRVLRRHDLLAVDTGAHQHWAGRLYPVYQPGTYYSSGHFQATGFALPAAIGLAAAVGRTGNHRVVALMGDAGFLQQAVELETAVRLGLPVTCVVAVDSTMAGLEQAGREQQGRGWATRFGQVAVARLAEALGARALVVQDPDQLGPVLRGAVDAQVPMLVAVPVDPAPRPLPAPPQAVAAAAAPVGAAGAP